MRLIDPTVPREPRHNFRAPPLPTVEGVTVGLLSNGKLNADVLLRETAALFATHHRCQLRDLACKPNFGAPAPAELIDQLAAECDFLLTAAGD